MANDIKENYEYEKSRSNGSWYMFKLNLIRVKVANDHRKNCLYKNSNFIPVCYSKLIGSLIFFVILKNN